MNYMRFLKLLGLLFSGIVLTYILYFVSLVTVPLLKQYFETWRGPEDIVPFLYLINLPVAIFIMSGLLGWLGKKLLDITWYEGIFISPGIYIAIRNLSTMEGTIGFFVFLMTISSVVGVLVSLISTFLGRRLFMKKYGVLFWILLAIALFILYRSGMVAYFMWYDSTHH